MPRKGRAAGKKKQAPAAVANEDVAITAVAGEAANVLWDEMKKMGFCEDGTEVSEVAKAMKQIELVFSYFDSDGDGFLSLDEFNNLQLATGSESVEKDDWPEVCGMFDLDPNKGFDVAALAVGYEGSTNGALVKDATMVLKLRQAERGELPGDEMEEIEDEDEEELEVGVVDPNDQERVDALAEHVAYDVPQLD